MGNLPSQVSRRLIQALQTKTEHPRNYHPSAYAMLTLRQLVDTIQVQLLTTNGPLPTIGPDNNSLLPFHRVYPQGNTLKNGPGTGR